MANEHRKCLLIYDYGMFEFELLLRLRRGLQAEGWSIAIVTHLLSVWVRARLEGIPCTLLRRTDKPLPAHLSLDGTPEGALDLISAATAARVGQAAWQALERAGARYGVTAIAQWNGLRFLGRVTTQYARAQGLPTVFFELGNLEPKLFADPDGVNAMARVARHPEMLDRHQASDEDIQAWRAALIERRRRGGAPPQARRLMNINPWFPVDWLGAVVLRIPQPLSMSVSRRVTERLRIRRRRMPPSIRPAAPYVFLPLQVSDDTNLLLFSDYDNLKALEYAAARARERGLLLVAKPHPAERDADLLERLTSLCADRGHLLTNYNTTELIAGAKEVITINSTVGLEALIMDKPLTILGRCVYANFTPRQASVFAMRHLLEMSPFDEGEASADVVRRIVEIIEDRSART